MSSPKKILHLEAGKQLEKLILANLCLRSLCHMTIYEFDLRRTISMNKSIRVHSQIPRPLSFQIMSLYIFKNNIKNFFAFFLYPPRFEARKRSQRMSLTFRREIPTFVALKKSDNKAKSIKSVQHRSGAVAKKNTSVPADFLIHLSVICLLKKYKIRSKWEKRQRQQK